MKPDEGPSAFDGNVFQVGLQNDVEQSESSMTRRSGVFEPSSGRARSVKDVREKVLSVSGE